MAESQFVTQCRYCKSKYYVHQDTPPAVVLKPQIDAKTAKDIVLKELRDKEIDAHFLANSFFEHAVLYFIPFYELRGIKAGFAASETSQQPEYNYIAFESLDKADNLEDLTLGFFDHSMVEDALVSAEQQPFNPVEMRKQGVIIPPTEIHNLERTRDPKAREAVESYARIIYFPIWEISYTYKGILFKSYASAVDGRPLKIQGLRCHKRKLGMSLGGLLSLAVLLGRGINTGGAGLILAAVFALPVSALLIPYFWELFAFQEIVEKRGELISYETINYTENAFVQFSHKVVDGFLSLLGVLHDEDDESDY